jgi:hypothetical protein
MGASNGGGGDPVAPYLKHGMKFGLECVSETAEADLKGRLRKQKLELRGRQPLPVELTWLPFTEREQIFDKREDAFAVYRWEFYAAERECAEALARLRVELDAIDADRSTARRYRPRPPRRRRSRVETIETVQRLRAEGLVVSAIAAKLGVADKTVRRYLNPKNGAANPHGYATKSAPRSESVSPVVRTVSVHPRLVGVA